ncbi:hypothetical protein SAMN05428989_1905 [Pseudoxanthomonas sp. GM95]|uniref:hypothetical protein n=1 Tax=Pseudoxanthomonas sp. GM95 TaxID=1881043 RepID=UPI0008AF69EC|nr:hypothetical protein [Pseudoxanthomonas sp. GM95]SEL55171.1 hypothetical protein SAMN05428989_1905 [Pseudoxanthomonas sp. GM95]
MLSKTWFALHLLAWSVLGALLSCDAHAGVTIHFDGHLRQGIEIDDIASAACRSAEGLSWRCVLISGASDPKLDQITIDMLCELEGNQSRSSALGVVIYPNEMSEPLYLVVGEARAFKNFVKTQFAGANAHIGVIHILDAIKPFTDQLDVVDEGRYWTTRDRKLLEEDLASVASQMQMIKLQHPNAKGPIKRPDGRILDLASD